MDGSIFGQPSTGSAKKVRISLREALGNFAAEMDGPGGSGTEEALLAVGRAAGYRQFPRLDDAAASVADSTGRKDIDAVKLSAFKLAAVRCLSEVERLPEPVLADLFCKTVEGEITVAGSSKKHDPFEDEQHEGARGTIGGEEELIALLDYGERREALEPKLSPQELAVFHVLEANPYATHEEIARKLDLPGGANQSRQISHKIRGKASGR